MNVCYYVYKTKKYVFAKDQDKFCRERNLTLLDFPFISKELTLNVIQLSFLYSNGPDSSLSNIHLACY